ncbi:MAG TPA: polyphosphate:AMP phosphotransferase [Vicinamibacterales bacterium]|nr:polyphosphate:AMP phosphotransferase [Vicinamibacterales bacterium]
MFEAAEVGRKLAKENYKAQVPVLRAELLEVQRELLKAPFPVIVLFAGVDAAGKGETASLLSEWMDPRWIVTRGYMDPSGEDLERPRLWRYWRDLPPHGRLAIFLSAWYSSPIRQRVARRITTPELDGLLDQVAAFERALTDDGAVVVKFWMHLGKAAQKKRFKAFEKDPLRRWRVTKDSWRHWRMFDRFVSAADRAIRKTSTDHAPWHIVEGEDERYRSIVVATELRDAIRRGLERAQAVRSPSRPGRKTKRAGASDIGETLQQIERKFNVLDELEMQQRLGRKSFETALEKQQGRLNLLQRKASAKGVSTVVVFEGWDAAGKGGAIRRITGALDARDYQVIPIGAPTDEERVRHYLWRFWRHLSRAGRITIFDRSWYGRVLVERVEGFATDVEYRRAYGEIAHFEEQLVAHGILLVKLWIHITKDEQLRRFRDRKRTMHKQWKITDEDWRNRGRWADYTLAVDEMVARTSTRVAPWTLVEGNDKNFARIKILTALADRLDRRLHK